MQTEREQNKRIFEEMPVPRAVLTMAIPTVISQIIVLIYNMADTFFIGRTNDPMMVAGASLILPIFNVSVAFANIAGTGGGTLIARLLGRGRIGDARRVASFSILFSVGSGAVFSLLTAGFMSPLLRLLGASGDTFGYARGYASCVIVAGAVPTVTALTLANLLRSVGRAREAGFGASMGGLINIALDPLFMFVLLPRGMETTGAGIATALSNFLVCVYFLVVIARSRSEVLTLSFRRPVPGREEVRSFFTVGLSAAVGPFLFDLDYIVLDRLMAGHSDVALAAVGIVLKAERLPLNIGVGLCLGMVPLAAYSFSAGNYRRMEDILRFTRRSGVAVGVAGVALYELLAPDLIRLFIGDEATVFYGARFLRIRAAALIFMFLCFSYVLFFQAVGRGGYSLALVALRWLAANIPMLYLLNALFGMYGLVWAQAVSDTAVAFLSWLIYRRFRRMTASPDG